MCINLTPSTCCPVVFRQLFLADWTNCTTLFCYIGVPYHMLLQDGDGDGDGDHDHDDLSDKRNKNNNNAKKNIDYNHDEDNNDNKHNDDTMREGFLFKNDKAYSCQI